MDLVIILVKVDTAIGLVLLTVVTLSLGIIPGVNPSTQMTVKPLVIGVGRKVISDLTVLTMDHEYLWPKL
jgi:hypothetical protein